MVQWVKILYYKRDNQHLVPEIYKAEGENRLLQAINSLTTGMLWHVQLHPPTYTNQ